MLELFRIRRRGGWRHQWGPWNVFSFTPRDFLDLKERLAAEEELKGFVENKIRWAKYQMDSIRSMIADDRLRIGSILIRREAA